MSILIRNHRISLIAIVLAATLPFINKAFHIDDVLYLRVAEQILRTPWDPYGRTVDEYILWDAKDGQPATLFDTDFNPPLWKYVLAAAIATLGREEWKLHLVSMAFVAMSAWGLYLLSHRLTGRPIWCVVMIILSPFFLPGQNLMLEVPVLAFISWGSYFQWRSWDKGTAFDSLIAGLLIGLAILTKYTIGLFLPLFVLGSVLAMIQRKENASWKSFLFLIPSVALLGIWCAHNLYFYGQMHLTSHGVGFKPEEWPARALVVFRIVGAVSLLGPVWWVSLWKRGASARIGLFVIFALSIGLGMIDLEVMKSIYSKQGKSLAPILQGHALVFTFLGGATVLSVGWSSCLSLLKDRQNWWRSFDDRQLELWMIALFAFNVCSVPFNAVRHLLVFFLAMTWLTGRVADRGSMKILPIVLAVGSILLAYTLAAGDYAYAEMNRQIPETRIRADRLHASQVWYSGTWGFKYYAEREGAKPYFPGIERYNMGRPIAGDRVYLPKLQNWAPVMETIPSAQVIDIIAPPHHNLAMTISRGASYYGTTLHLLPWVTPIVVDFPEGSPRVSWMPIDLILVYELGGAGGLPIE